MGWEGLGREDGGTDTATFDDACVVAAIAISVLLLLLLLSYEMEESRALSLSLSSVNIL